MQIVSVAPMNELLLRDGRWTCHVIYDLTATLGSGIHIDDNLSALPAYIAFTGGIGRTIKRVVAESVRIIGEQIPGIDIDIIAHLGQVLMIQRTA